MNLADTRLDIRTETELFWRFRYADAEASGLHSVWPDRLTERPPPAGELRCGPVYVPSGQTRFPDWEADLSGMRAYHLARRIDFALERTAQAPILRLAFEARPDPELVTLCPVLPRGPCLANLVPHVAEPHWRASRSSRPLRAWLARHAARAASGHGDTRLLRDLSLAASALLASAGREYGHWRRRAA